MSEQLGVSLPSDLEWESLEVWVASATTIAGTTFIQVVKKGKVKNKQILDATWVAGQQNHWPQCAQHDPELGDFRGHRHVPYACVNDNREALACLVFVTGCLEALHLFSDVSSVAVSQFRARREGGR